MARTKTAAATRALLAGSATALLAIGSAPIASAHDSVVDATPGIDATVTEFPTEIVLEFSGLPKDDFNTIALSRIADNEVVFSGEPEINEREVSIALPDDIDAQPGEYRIGYQITSSDGHATKGMTSFTFEPAGAAGENTAPGGEAAQSDQETGEADTDQTSDEAEQETGSGYNWLWMLLGALLLGGVGIAALSRRQRHDDANQRVRDMGSLDEDPKD